MKTLTQILKEKAQCGPDNDLLSVWSAEEAVIEWLTEKRQERECNDFSKDRFQILAFYNQLLEELK